MGQDSPWYSTQKEHWLGWLKEYSGPGYYGRKNWNRDAEFAYNHVVCPPMVLWLGEAFGISPILVRKAKKAALDAPPSLPAQSAAIRTVIPWSMIESRLSVPSEVSDDEVAVTPTVPDYSDADIFIGNDGCEEPEPSTPDNLFAKLGKKPRGLFPNRVRRRWVNGLSGTCTTST